MPITPLTVAGFALVFFLVAGTILGFRPVFKTSFFFVPVVLVLVSGIVLGYCYAYYMFVKDIDERVLVIFAGTAILLASLAGILSLRGYWKVCREREKIRGEMLKAKKDKTDLEGKGKEETRKLNEALRELAETQEKRNVLELQLLALGRRYLELGGELPDVIIVRDKENPKLLEKFGKRIQSLLPVRKT